MKLTKTITLSILTIALTATMLAAGPILAEHQVFAHLRPHYPNNLGGVYYGPCFQGKLLFSYTWCVKPGL